MSDKYKTYEELKEELGNNYDLFMYEINLCLLQKIDKAIEYIEKEYYSKNTVDIDKIVLSSNKLLKIRQILKGEDNV